MTEEKIAHGLVQQQLFTVSQELVDTRLLLTTSEKLLLESQQATYDVKQELEVARPDLRRAEFHCSISQTALSDLQHVATNARREADAAKQDGYSNLQAIRALDSVRQTLNPAFPPFNPLSSDFFPSAQKFTAEIHSRLPAQHLRIADELESCVAANQEYATELRSLLAENAKLRAKLAHSSQE